MVIKDIDAKVVDIPIGDQKSDVAWRFVCLAVVRTFESPADAPGARASPHFDNEIWQDQSQTVDLGLDLWSQLEERAMLCICAADVSKRFPLQE